MSAAQLDLTIEQGATWFHTLTLQNNPGKTPLNLTGYTAKMQIRSDFDSVDVICELSTENDKINFDALNGKIMLEIPSSETLAFGFVRAMYDLVIVSPTGKTQRVIQGTVTLLRAITR